MQPSFNCRLTKIAPICFAVALTQSAYSMTYVTSPEGAWSYSRLGTSLHSGDYNYFPTNVSEFEQASFVGYVKYWEGNDGWLMDRGAIVGYHVFKTWCTSAFDLTVNFINGGDDGHAVFLDGVFLGGNGFGTNTSGSFFLAAGVARELTVVTHNAGGEMHATIFSNPEATLPLENIQGLTLNAVPEISTTGILAAFAAYGMLRRKRNC